MQFMTRSCLRSPPPFSPDLMTTIQFLVVDLRSQSRLYHPLSADFHMTNRAALRLYTIGRSSAAQLAALVVCALAAGERFSTRRLLLPALCSDIARPAERALLLILRARRWRCEILLTVPFYVRLAAGIFGRHLTVSTATGEGAITFNAIMARLRGSPFPVAFSLCSVSDSSDHRSLPRKNQRSVIATLWRGCRRISSIGYTTAAL